MSRFDGFGGGACAWFEGIEAENTRDWFHANKPAFEAEIKTPFAALLADAADAFGGEAKVMRQNRDTRFSKDKSPYKTAIYGMVRAEGRVMAMWAMLNARDFFAGAGVYRMTPAQLARYRGAVAGGGVAALEAAVAASGLELGGDGTRGAPRGYPKDHPRLDLLRRKALTLGARIPAPEAVADAARARAHAMAAWEKTRAASLWMDAEVGA